MTAHISKVQLKAAMISELEIRTAIRLLVADNGMALPEEIAKAVTGLLGFQRTGSELRAAIIKQIDRMLSSGEVQTVGDGLVALGAVK